MADFAVDMEIDRGALGHQFAQKDQPFPDEFEIFGAQQRVAVRDAVVRAAADVRGSLLIVAEDGIGRKRRVDVDEVDLAAQAVLPQQALHDGEVIAADQHPAFAISGYIAEPDIGWFCRC